jgi:hypothetical protein
MAKTEGQPWDRHEGEPARAYSLFVMYRDLGRTRTVQELADKVNRSRGYLNQICAKWLWVKRAEAWDHEADRLFSAKMLDRRLTSAEITLGIVSAARSKLVAALQALDPTKLTAGEIMRWFEVLTKVERETMGLPGTVVGHTGSDGGDVKVRVEELDDEARRAFLVKLIAEANSRAGLVGEADVDDEVGNDAAALAERTEGDASGSTDETGPRPATGPAVDGR